MESEVRTLAVRQHLAKFEGRNRRLEIECIVALKVEERDIAMAYIEKREGVALELEDSHGRSLKKSEVGGQGGGATDRGVD